MEEEYPWRTLNEPIIVGRSAYPTFFIYMLARRLSGMANDGFAGGHVALLGPADFPSPDTLAGQVAYPEQR